MPFDRPALADIISRVATDIVSRLPGGDARLRRNFLAVLARVQAGAVHGLYGYLDFISRQVMPDTAETEYLDRWAGIWGITRKAAAAAQGDVAFTGVSGSTIPADTLLQRSDGAEFTTDAEATLADGAATAAVTAVEAGEDGNTEAASTLTLVNPVSGVNSEAVVDDDGLTGGADTESDDDLRQRLLDRIKEPPHGGADFDYKAWALETAGVTRAWCFPAWLGLGTVGVSFVCDDQESSIIPDAGMVTAVQDYIDARRPVTAAVTVFAPTPVEVDFTIALTPDTATVRAAVEAELVDLLRREAEVEDGDGSGTILLSHIREAISMAAGETDHVLTAPAANVELDAGEIAVMGTVTWV